MTARHTLILEALGLGPRWLPRPPLVASLDADMRATAAAEVTQEPCPPVEKPRLPS